MKKINLKKISKTLKLLRPLTGGIFNISPAKVSVHITAYRYRRKVEIFFDVTGNIAEIHYSDGKTNTVEHSRDVGTISEIIREVLDRPIYRMKKETGGGNEDGKQGD